MKSSRTVKNRPDGPQTCMSAKQPVVGGRHWVNVDKPTRMCTIHGGGCTYEENKSETPLKGVGQLRRDGGWLSFGTREDVEEYCRVNWKGFNVRRHC